MRRDRKRDSGASRNVLAVVGLLLMLASLVWLQLFPSARQPVLSSKSKRAGEILLVVIDAGHGGIDSGTSAGNVLEKDLTLDVARRLRRLVQAKGLEAMLTREQDIYKSLAKRAELANRQRHCVFISIHYDEGQRAAATGVETSWLPFLQHTVSDSPNLLSQSLAGFVQESLVKRTQSFDRGTMAQQFYVIANVHHPAVLVEGGFLSNKDDVAKLTSEEYREQLAAAICEGILRYRDTLRNRQPALAVATPES
jgi:N-acetylmuramoyl-L-alanine amidase